ncbi:MAG: ABC transporter substrate-binding protein [Candidatus Thorarchaeota archaeon]|jgi:ABC-type transport system substrate-binding protein
MGCRKPKYAAVMIVFLMMMMISPVWVSAQTVPYEDWTKFLHQGPYIDKAVSKVSSSKDASILWLLNDEIDAIGGQIDPENLPELGEAENIGLEGTLRNGYGHLTINCAKYPYNITAFRRALAFALDKEMISDDIWVGESQPHDSIVAAPNPFTIEGQLPYTYYTAQPEIGNQLLDEAGFHDVDADGTREAPDGSEFHVVVEGGQQSEIAMECANAAADALDSLDISAEAKPSDFYEYLARLNLHGDYDIIFYGFTFGSGYDIDWLIDSYGSMYADIDYANSCNFRNASFDALIPQLLYATEYDEVYDAAIRMQEILVYESPRIVCYNNIAYSAFRTDRFENHVIDPNLGLDEGDTLRKVHLKLDKGGPWGGTYRFSNGKVDTFNPFKAGTSYAWRVLGQLYVSLIRTGPDAVHVPFFAESYDIQTNVDNPDIPVGYTRIIFDMIQNGTWSDGEPITAEDVAFSLNYMRDGLEFGIPAGHYLDDLTVAYAASPFRVIVEFDTLSYWHLGNAGGTIILPKHIFKDIPVNQWNLFNPVKGDSPHVTAGPFTVTEHIAGEFTEITYRPDWAYGLGIHPTDTTSLTDPTEPTTMPFDITMAIVAGAVGASVVILTGGFALLRRSSDIPAV